MTPPTVNAYFNPQGNPHDWWTKEFEDRINCGRDQYAGYVIVDDIHINSKLMSGEDVADLGGTLLAYITWKKRTETDASLRMSSSRSTAERVFLSARWSLRPMPQVSSAIWSILSAISREALRTASECIDCLTCSVFKDGRMHSQTRREVDLRSQKLSEAIFQACHIEEGETLAGSKSAKRSTLDEDMSSPRATEPKSLKCRMPAVLSSAS